MTVAIFCKEYCPHAAAMVHYFRDNNHPVGLVVVETKVRTKDAPSQIKFREAHQAFNRWLENSKGATAEESLWRRRIKSLLGPLASPIRRALARQRARIWRDSLLSPLAWVDKHSSQETVELLQRHSIRYALISSTGWLIKEPLLSMPGLLILNAHSGKLPEHRSLDSMPWSILADAPVGNTVHVVDAGVDTGDIILFEELKPRKGDTLKSLKSRLTAMRPQLFLRAVRGTEDGSIRPTPQRPEDGTHHEPMSFEQLKTAQEHLEELVARQEQKT